LSDETYALFLNWYPDDVLQHDSWISIIWAFFGNIGVKYDLLPIIKYIFY